MFQKIAPWMLMVFLARMVFVGAIWMVEDWRVSYKNECRRRWEKKWYGEQVEEDCCGNDINKFLIDAYKYREFWGFLIGRIRGLYVQAKLS